MIRSTIVCAATVFSSRDLPPAKVESCRRIFKAEITASPREIIEFIIVNYNISYFTRNYIKGNVIYDVKINLKNDAKNNTENIVINVTKINTNDNTEIDNNTKV